LPPVDFVSIQRFWTDGLFSTPPGQAGGLVCQFLGFLRRAFTAFRFLSLEQPVGKGLFFCGYPPPPPGPSLGSFNFPESSPPKNSNPFVHGSHSWNERLLLPFIPPPPPFPPGAAPPPTATPEVPSSNDAGGRGFFFFPSFPFLLHLFFLRGRSLLLRRRQILFALSLAVIFWRGPLEYRF